MTALERKIDALRSLGYEVKVLHSRRVANKYGEQVSSFDPSARTILPRGGHTVAQVRRAGALVAEGAANCHPDDNYDRRLGAIKALGRAEGELLRAGHVAPLGEPDRSRAMAALDGPPNLALARAILDSGEPPAGAVGLSE